MLCLPGNMTNCADCRRFKGERMISVRLDSLTEYELNDLKRDVNEEITRRAKGPMRIVYEVRQWDSTRTFVDLRCAALCFSDIAESLLEDAATDDGKALIDLNKGTRLYSFRPIQITEADFQAKVKQLHFDDICYENRLENIGSAPKEK